MCVVESPAPTPCRRPNRAFLPFPWNWPRRIPCLGLKFSTHPELALNLSSGIWSCFPTSFALFRITESVSCTFLSRHSYSHLASSDSISGNFDGLNHRQRDTEK